MFLICPLCFLQNGLETGPWANVGVSGDDLNRMHRKTGYIVTVPCRTASTRGTRTNGGVERRARSPIIILLYLADGATRRGPWKRAVIVAVYFDADARRAYDDVDAAALLRRAKNARGPHATGGHPEPLDAVETYPRPRPRSPCDICVVFAAFKLDFTNRPVRLMFLYAPWASSVSCLPSDRHGPCLLYTMEDKGRDGFFFFFFFLSQRLRFVTLMLNFNLHCTGHDDNGLYRCVFIIHGYIYIHVRNISYVLARMCERVFTHTHIYVYISHALCAHSSVYEDFPVYGGMAPRRKRLLDDRRPFARKAV